jgi:hypothetical protein
MMIRNKTITIALTWDAGIGVKFSLAFRTLATVGDDVTIINIKHGGRATRQLCCRTFTKSIFTKRSSGSVAVFLSTQARVIFLGLIVQINSATIVG